MTAVTWPPAIFMAANEWLLAVFLPRVCCCYLVHVCRVQIVLYLFIASHYYSKPEYCAIQLFKTLYQFSCIAHYFL